MERTHDIISYLDVVLYIRIICTGLILEQACIANNNNNISISGVHIRMYLSEHKGKGCMCIFHLDGVPNAHYTLHHSDIMIYTYTDGQVIILPSQPYLVWVWPARARLHMCVHFFSSQRCAVAFYPLKAKVQKANERQSNPIVAMVTRGVGLL